MWLETVRIWHLTLFVVGKQHVACRRVAVNNHLKITHLHLFVVFVQPFYTADGCIDFFIDFQFVSVEFIVILIVIIVVPSATSPRVVVILFVDI